MEIFNENQNQQTLMGWERRIDEKKLITNDPSHFWTLISPNSIPRAIINRIETIINKNDKP